MSAARPHTGRIAIIGGGIAGVAAAYELSVRYPGHAFTLYEASSRLGGTVETVTAHGFIIECGPDSWVTEKPWARELAEELGLADEIIASNDHQRRTYILRDRQLMPMPDGMRMMVPTQWEPLLHSPLLSWRAKLDYLREAKRADELKETALDRRGSFADESVQDFVVRHFGEEAAFTLAGPLLSGVFGGDIAKLSVRAVMAPFVKMEAEHGSLIEALRLRAAASAGHKPATFTSLRSGLGMMIDRMAAKIPPGSLRMHTPVASIAHQSAVWQVESRSGEVAQFDELLLATPAHITRRLLATAGSPVAAEIGALLPTEASSALVVALGYAREKAVRLRIPRGFGFLAPAAQHQGKNTSLMACTFVDQKFDGRAPQGGILLRAFFGGEAALQLAGQSDGVLAETARRQLSAILGPLPEPDVSVVRAWPDSLPQYFVGHVERIAQAEQLSAKLPSLHLIGNAYHGVGLPDLVRDARNAVRAISGG